MGEYTFRTFRKLLAATLVFSLLWPDLARCMEDEEENPSIHINLIQSNTSDQKKNSPSEDFKNEDNRESNSEKNNASEEITNKNENSSTTNVIETNIVPIEEKFSEKKEETLSSQTTSFSKENESNKEIKIEENNSRKNSSQELGKNRNLEELIRILKEESQVDPKKETANSIKTDEGEKGNNSQKPLLLDEKRKEEKGNEPPKVPTNTYTNEKDDFVLTKNQEYKVELSEDDPFLGEEGNIQDNFLKQAVLFKKHLGSLRINLQNFNTGELDALDEILKIEGTWRNSLIWSNLTILIHQT